MGVRVILTTGGTGGHIFPALAVAEQLRREGAELLFVGSQYGSEAKLAKQAGLEFRGLPCAACSGAAFVPWARCGGFSAPCSWLGLS